MAVNMKKHGYSTPEVGQILGVTYATVRRMVEKGTIKGTIQKGEKRSIVRIPREALIEYLRANRECYPEELLLQFGIRHEEETQNEIDTLMSTPGASVTIEPGTDLNDIPSCGTYLINDDDCCGVAPTVKTSIPTYEVLVNGRISVGNVQKGTAIDILRTLTSDPVFQFDEITIRKGN